MRRTAQSVIAVAAPMRTAWPASEPVRDEIVVNPVVIEIDTRTKRLRCCNQCRSRPNGKPSSAQSPNRNPCRFLRAKMPGLSPKHAKTRLSEFETHGQYDSGICPPSIEDVGSKIYFFVREACEEAPFHIKRCLICTGFLRSEPNAEPLRRRIG
jgi:hypothetical protein